MKRTLDLTYDEIIIGADLSALCYSYIKKAPVIYLRKLKPNKFDSDYNKWDQIMFFLSLHNLVPFNDNLQTIRFEDDNTLRLVTKENYICNIKFNSCVISDDYLIHGINFSNRHESKNNLVLDWFKIDNMKPHNEDIILRNDNFLKKVKFYKSERFKTYPQGRDVVAFSYLTNEEIQSGDYSEVVSRIYLNKIFKENAIYPKKDANVTIKLTNREFFTLEKNQYDGLPENVKILNESAQQILKMEKKDDKYFEYLERLFNGYKDNS